MKLCKPWFDSKPQVTQGKDKDYISRRRQYILNSTTRT